MSKKVVWLTDDGRNIFVVRLGPTSNKKIIGDPKEKIVQTYTFSIDQWHLVTTQDSVKPDQFFALDGANCMDCEFSGNVNEKSGKCYTHKGMQFMGMLSMLRSIHPEMLTPISESKWITIIQWSANRYVRFGTYGEPSVMDPWLVKEMAKVSYTYTGYTHQWANPDKQVFKQWFMASASGRFTQLAAERMGWRTFIASDKGDEQAVHCPASNEMGFKSNCAKCGLCSGTEGKGKKSVKILNHA